MGKERKEGKKKKKKESKRGGGGGGAQDKAYYQLLIYIYKLQALVYDILPSFRWCLMSSDVGWHIRDKLRPVRDHGSILLYVHGNQKAR